MYIKHQDAQNPLIKLYSTLKSLYVSSYISPSSGAKLYRLQSHLTENVSTCHHCMARHQVEDGGMASIMEDSCG